MASFGGGTLGHRARNLSLRIVKRAWISISISYLEGKIRISAGIVNDQIWCIQASGTATRRASDISAACLYARALPPIYHVFIARCTHAFTFALAAYAAICARRARSFCGHAHVCAPRARLRARSIHTGRDIACSSCTHLPRASRCLFTRSIAYTAIASIVRSSGALLARFAAARRVTSLNAYARTCGLKNAHLHGSPRAAYHTTTYRTFCTALRERCRVWLTCTGTFAAAFNLYLPAVRVAFARHRWTPRITLCAAHAARTHTRTTTCLPFVHLRTSFHLLTASWRTRDDRHSINVHAHARLRLLHALCVRVAGHRHRARVVL